MSQNEKSSSTNRSETFHATDMTRRMICGGVAGMIAKTATNPLERIKMLAQTGEHGATTRQSVFHLYRSILRNEGIVGLWAGNGANLLRVFPAKAVVFSCNDHYKRLLHSAFNTPKGQPLSAQGAFIAGGLAGMTATFVTYPLDLARGRISGKLKIHGSQHVYNGILHTMILTVKEEGFFALFKGVSPTVLGAMPYEGIKFGTVGMMELLFPHDRNSGDKPPVWRKLVFGGIGGCMAGIITYPNDTIRRLLQLQGSRGTVHSYQGYWDCVRKVYATQGIGRFYHGMVINIVRMAPNTAVQFGSYEMLKRLSDKYMI